VLNFLPLQVTFFKQLAEYFFKKHLQNYLIMVQLKKRIFSLKKIKTVLIVNIDDTGNACEALKQSLKAFNFFVLEE